MDEEVATMVSYKKKSIVATVAHTITGHINEAQSCKIVKHLGYTVSRGSMPKCETCAKVKAKKESPIMCCSIRKGRSPKRGSIRDK
eukprot:15366716-Ditylum_brightwellii.AAC.1